MRSTKKVVKRRKRQYKRRAEAKTTTTTPECVIEEKRGPGRPRGARTFEPVVMQQHVTYCPKCKSTARTRYYNARTIKVTKIVDGVKYTQVTISNTKCRHCGQHRNDHVWR